MKTDELYDNIRRTTGSANTQDTEIAFLDALKKVVSDINRMLGESITAPTQITSTDIGFEDYCDNAFHPGVKFYMQRDGAWAQDPDAESFGFYRRALREAIGDAIAADTGFKTRNQASS
jgi:hypothetical protein